MTRAIVLLYPGGDDAGGGDGGGMTFFRIYYTVAGGHTHTRWFAGQNREGSMGKAGDLTFRNEEFEELRSLLKQAQIEFVEEGKIQCDHNWVGYHLMPWQFRCSKCGDEHSTLAEFREEPKGE